MTTPRRTSNFRPRVHKSEFLRKCEVVVSALKEEFAGDGGIANFIRYYDYNPVDEDTNPFSVIVAPGNIAPADEPDWGTGDVILEGTIDIFISYRYRSQSEADTCIYWAEQIFAWAQYKDIGGLGVTRPVDIEYIDLLDSDENPDISRLAIKVSVTFPYYIKSGREEPTGARLQFLSINQEVRKQLLHIITIDDPEKEFTIGLSPIDIMVRL